MSTGKPLYYCADRLKYHLETFAETVPNYDKFPIVHKTLTGVEIDRHVLRTAASVKQEAEAKLPELTDDNLMLTTPILYGFSLSDKQWRMSILSLFEC